MLNLVNLHTSYLVTIRQPGILTGIDKVVVAVLRLSLILFPTVYVKLACVLLAMLKDIKNHLPPAKLTASVFGRLFSFS